MPFAQRYGYVGGNPANATDPYGLFCIGSKAVCDKISDAKD